MGCRGNRRGDSAGGAVYCVSEPLQLSLKFVIAPPTTLTDRNGNVTTYAYDANARLATVRQRPDPLANPTLVYTTSVTRDASGNAARITQANGVATDYAYDALDRLVSVTAHPAPTAR